MPLVLGRYLNKRFIQLDEHTRGQAVGVLRRSGGYQYVRWLGFISREDAKKLGRPVKLEVRRIGRQDALSVEWKEVPPGKHVQGCLVREGAYAVVEPAVKVV